MLDVAGKRHAQRMPPLLHVLKSDRAADHMRCREKSVDARFHARREVFRQHVGIGQDDFVALAVISSVDPVLGEVDR